MSIKKNGYVMIHSPGHHRAIPSTGYVFEHILVMEEMLGRTLLPGETIHHINGKKEDNRRENLMLFPSKAAHASFHQQHRQTPTAVIERNNRIKELMLNHTVVEIAGIMGLTRSQVDHAIRDYQLGTRVSAYTRAWDIAERLKKHAGNKTLKEMAEEESLTLERIRGLCTHYGITYKKEQRRKKTPKKRITPSDFIPYKFFRVRVNMVPRDQVRVIHSTQGPRNCFPDWG